MGNNGLTVCAPESQIKISQFKTHTQTLACLQRMQTGYTAVQILFETFTTYISKSGG